MIRIIFTACVLVVCIAQASGFEEKKSFKARKAEQAMRIDGTLSESVWSEASIATDFIQYSPYNGAGPAYKTEVRVVYDETAIYIGAFMYDPFPDSILTTMGKRDSDRNLNADHFSFDINPFNDGVNGMTFKVSASGIKTDKKRTGEGRRGTDLNWDEVWQSAVTIHQQGWTAELKIPYSALRFPKGESQVWSVNFWREIRRKREWSTWNYVDNEVGNSFNYLGQLEGLQNINPPLRLSITPYVSGYIEKDSKEPRWGTSFNGGVDIKYGITESFTLDMTLIPDFGQVQSDDIVLNLSPFEVKYNEKRPFFTEGTELFNKGNIFYSRRVGTEPAGFYRPYRNLGTNEEVIFNPVESRLINATKISGRTENGLGIGVFNGMSAGMYAEIKDKETGEKRTELTAPFTNYNMIVFDKSLNYNSYFSVQNTNVWRDAPKDEDFYTVNVSSTDFHFLNKSNIYSIRGQAALSQKYYDSLDTDLGYRVSMTMGKTGGVFRAEYTNEIISDRFDPNDMGFERQRNEMSHRGRISYNIFQPVGIIQSARNSFEAQYSSQYKPNAFSELELSLNSFVSFLNFWMTRVELKYTPYGTHDFYEPRMEGRSFYRYPTTSFEGFLFTDSRKNVYGRFNFDVSKPYSPYDQFSYKVGIEPTVRVNDRFQFSFETKVSGNKNDLGYVGKNAAKDSIYFGMRNTSTISNMLASSYIFSNKAWLTLRLRHYWSRADYLNKYYLLQGDGYLEPLEYTGADDINFNTVNIDVVYIWRFAPGSQISIVWKNSIFSYENRIRTDYIDNIRATLKAHQINSFSIKVLYYLDYQYLKRRNRSS